MWNTFSADETRSVRDIIVQYRGVIPWHDANEEDTAIVNAVREYDWNEATTCLLGSAFACQGGPWGTLLSRTPLFLSWALVRS